MVNTDLMDLSSSLPSSLSSQYIFSLKESEQLPVTPKARSTPHSSFSNLMFEDAHKIFENDEELPLAPSSPLPSLFNPSCFDNHNLDFVIEDSDFYDKKPILGLLDDSLAMPCSGQPVEWTPGSVWDSYAYQMHNDNSLSWNLIGFQGNNFIIIQSKDDCTGSLFSAKERD